MDKDRVKGMVDQVAGRAKRQTAEWTGDTRAQVEGGLQELKGGIRKAWGEAKDAVREAARDAEKDKAPHSEHAAAEHINR